MAACTGIDMSAIYDCENPLKAGVAETIFIGNLADISEVIYDVVNTNVITNIVMKVGLPMFSYEGVRSSNIPDQSLVTDEIASSYKHQIDFSVFDVSSMMKANLQGMAAKKTFVIYQNPKDSSLVDSVWEVLGIGAGLEMTTLSRLPASKDGSYKIQLATPEAAAETTLPASFWDTDIPITEAAVLALLVPNI